MLQQEVAPTSLFQHNWCRKEPVPEMPVRQEPARSSERNLAQRTSRKSASMVTRIFEMSVLARLLSYRLIPQSPIRNIAGVDCTQRGVCTFRMVSHGRCQLVQHFLRMAPAEAIIQAGTA